MSTAIIVTVVCHIEANDSLLGTLHGGFPGFDLLLGPSAGDHMISPRSKCPRDIRTSRRGCPQQANAPTFLGLDFIFALAGAGLLAITAAVYVIFRLWLSDALSST